MKKEDFVGSLPCSGRSKYCFYRVSVFNSISTKDARKNNHKNIDVRIVTGTFHQSAEGRTYHSGCYYQAKVKNHFLDFSPDDTSCQPLLSIFLVIKFNVRSSRIW
jgi:hypothetical protein